MGGASEWGHGWGTECCNGRGHGRGLRMGSWAGLVEDEETTVASWKEPWPRRAVQQPGAYTTGNNQGRVSPALSTGWTLLRGSIAQPSVLLELVPTLDGCSAPRTPDLPAEPSFHGPGAPLTHQPRQTP